MDNAHCCLKEPNSPSIHAALLLFDGLAWTATGMIYHRCTLSTVREVRYFPVVVILIIPSVIPCILGRSLRTLSLLLSL